VSGSIVSTGTYMPDRWMPASEIAELSGIPESVILDRFGLEGKHIAGDDDHVSTMSAWAGIQALERAGVDATEVDVVAYFGSKAMDYQVWSASPKVIDLIGASNAWALEMANVSCGGPVAIATAASILSGDPTISNILLVGGCRESHLIDYRNGRSRFMFNFGDGGAAALMSRSPSGHEVLGYRIISDGQFADDVAVYAGGTRLPASHETVDRRAHYLDVHDPVSMKERLDPVSGANFLKVATEACERAGVSLSDIRLLPILHTKRSFHEWIVDNLGIPRERAVYIDRNGHMSGLDTIVGLDLRQDELVPGDLVLMLSAGTGYTWAATVIRW
jgi:3-oxoacyl-[acyl-carrier-protein] synthase III